MMDRRERAEVFGRVYENNLWGRARDGRKYNSDSPPELTELYRGYVGGFLRAHDEVEVVVDLGCGDFELAGGIDFGDAHYVGVDLYEPLVEHNRRHHAGERREFHVRDLVEDPLPPGDLCLISMVLYLLSFEEVAAILRKLAQYRYALITDGQQDLEPHLRKNLDKPTDKYTRRDYYDNGFYLELPPFELDLDVVCEYRIPSGEILRTVLLDPPPGPDHPVFERLAALGPPPPGAGKRPRR